MHLCQVNKIGQYNTMLANIEENDRKIYWALLDKILLSNVGFYEIWLQQNAGDAKLFFSGQRKLTK